MPSTSQSSSSPSPSPSPSRYRCKTNPLNGSIVKRAATTTIQASASDNIGVTKVEFYIGSATTPFCVDTTTPYSCNWNVPGKLHAIYTLKAKVYDAASNNASSSIQVTAK